MSRSPTELKRDLAVAAAEVSRLRHTEADDAWRNYLAAKIEFLKEDWLDSPYKDHDAAKVKLLRELLRDLDLAKSGRSSQPTGARSRPTPAAEEI